MKLQTGTLEIAYDEAGAGQPVLFIHGYPLSRKLWQPQLAGLTGAARLIAPDLRGYGETPPGLPSGSPYSMDLLADDCAALLDALGVRRAVVCGLSMGGYVALAFYRRYPERVSGLVLTATRAGADSPEAAAGRHKTAQTVQEQGTAAVIEAMLPKLVSPHTLSSNPALLEQVRGQMASASGPGVVGALLGMAARPDSTPLLAQITCPVLVVHGADDQIIPPSQAEAALAAISGARLELLPAAGHLPNMEQPEAYNVAFGRFLANLK